MTKQEFIDRLRAALNGNVSPAQVTENVKYYEEYINTQIRMGKSEAEVLEGLGDPRLIAKSIGAANVGEDGLGAGGSYSTDNGYGSDASQQGMWSSYSYNDAYREGQSNDGSRTHKILRWLRPIVWIFIAAVVIMAFIGLVTTVLPMIFFVMMIVTVIMFFVKLFRDWLN